MRILAIADTPERLLYDAFTPERWQSRVDLVISCGDLSHEYLEFLVTVLNVPLLYVAGNHDSGYRTHPPEGCENIAGCVVTVGGLRIAGIAGCLRYNDDPNAYQFSEREVAWKMRWLGLKARRAGGLDLVVSHAAPLYCDERLDASDRAHQGVVAFRRFILRHRPHYWLHGHNHLLYSWIPRVTAIGDTTIINAYGHYLLDTEARPAITPITAAPGTLLSS